MKNTIYCNEAAKEMDKLSAAEHFLKCSLCQSLTKDWYDQLKAEYRETQEKEDIQE